MSLKEPSLSGSLISRYDGTFPLRDDGVGNLEQLSPVYHGLISSSETVPEI